MRARVRTTLRMYVPIPKEPTRRMSMATRTDQSFAADERGWTQITSDPHRCIVARAPFGVERELVAEAEHLFADARERGGVGAVVQRFGDPAADLLHLRFLHAARGDSGRADADAARLHRRIGVEWDRVLVDGDAGLAERLLGFGAEHAFGEDVHEHEVRVGAAGDDSEAFLGERLREDFGVGHDLA